VFAAGCLYLAGDGVWSQSDVAEVAGCTRRSVRNHYQLVRDEVDGPGGQS
jgi:transcription initiation factor TFIIIB Brf1 subunit/transcription initiation factor TFIIB